MSCKEDNKQLRATIAVMHRELVKNQESLDKKKREIEWLSFEVKKLKGDLQNAREAIEAARREIQPVDEYAE